MSLPATTLLHVSDLHARRPWFDWVSLQAEALGCAVVVSGDLLDVDARATPSSLGRQAEWIAAWVKAAHFPLFICSGNHDAGLDLNLDTSWLLALATPTITVDGGVGAWGGPDDRLSALGCNG